MQTAIFSAVVMVAITIVIAMGVAVLIKALFLTIRRLSHPKHD
jgi:hypothetical protein